MRKVDPADVRKQFVADTDTTLAYFDRVATALQGTKGAQADMSMLTMNNFLMLFIGFERFLSDLLLAYLNRDFTTYQQNLSSRVVKLVSSKLGPQAAGMVTIAKRKHVAVAELQRIVDPNGWNLTFATVDKLKATATEWLAPTAAARISTIATPEARLIESARAIRDLIGHQSAGARARVNDLLRDIEKGSHNKYLGRGKKNIQAIGPYLKASVSGRRRLHRYGDGLKNIAAHL